MAPDPAVLKRLEGLAGLLLLGLFTGLPLFTRTGSGPGDCSLRSPVAALVPLQSTARAASVNHLAAG